MDPDLEQSVIESVMTAFDVVDRIFQTVGLQLNEDREKRASVALSRAMPSLIPGHAFVHLEHPQVDHFISMVVDVRKSTRHLLDLRKTDALVKSGLQRLLLETSAVIAASSVIVSHFGGANTEYPGDGTLGFFRVDLSSKSRTASAVYRAYDAAEGVLQSVKEIINPWLKVRYELPPINVGIGMAYGEALVMLMGPGEMALPKAVGRCVYMASKLSKGFNTIRVDVPLNKLWPSEEGGKLNFSPIEIDGVGDAFEIDPG